MSSSEKNSAEDAKQDVSGGGEEGSADLGGARAESTGQPKLTLRGLGAVSGAEDAAESPKKHASKTLALPAAPALKAKAQPMGLAVPEGLSAKKGAKLTIRGGAFAQALPKPSSFLTKTTKPLEALNPEHASAGLPDDGGSRGVESLQEISDSAIEEISAGSIQAEHDQSEEDPSQPIPSMQPGDDGLNEPETIEVVGTTDEDLFDAEPTTVSAPLVSTLSDEPVAIFVPIDASQAQQNGPKTPGQATSSAQTPEIAPRTQSQNPPTPERQRSTLRGLSRIPSDPNPAAAAGQPPRVQPAQLPGAQDFAPQDDDFQAKKTEVFHSPFQHEALFGRLTALSGPAAGQEFLLNRQRNTIGRGATNTILIPDLAMSRQHLEILQESDQTYLLVDVHSANGTRLNHSKIVEAELRHGDRIMAGASEFQFVLPGAQAASRTDKRHIVLKQSKTSRPPPLPRHPAYMDQAPSRLDKLLTRIIIGASALSLGLIVLMVALVLTSPDPDEPGAQSAASDAAPDSSLQTLYLQGVEAVKDHEWDEAEQIFTRVQQEDASFADVSAQLSRVSREREIANILEDARGLVARNDYVEAIRLAAEVTHHSAYYEEAQGLLREARQLEINNLFQRAQQAASDEENEQAQALIAQILKAVPSHQGALNLRAILDGDAAKQAVEEMEQMEEPARAAAASASHTRQAQSGRAGAGEIAWDKPGAGAPRQSAGGQPRVQINFTRGFTLYKGAKFSEAVRYFRDSAASGDDRMAARARDTADKIERFSAVWTGANRALNNRAWASAANQFKEAHLADQKVARTAYFKAAIDDKLATAYAQLGIEALSQERYDVAYQNYQRAQRYKLANSAVNSLGGELTKKASAFYIQAASKRKNDPAQAKKLCRQVISMLAPTHELHQKARAMLADLDAK